MLTTVEMIYAGYDEAGNELWRETYDLCATGDWDEVRPQLLDVAGEFAKDYAAASIACYYSPVDCLFEMPAERLLARLNSRAISIS